jgi:transcriptional regulator with XRE-family HTH domain
MEKEALLTKLGQRIREIRIEKGITQAKLAHSLGKDQQSIQRLEAGNINPSYYYLHEIAIGLGTSVAELLRMPE